MLKKGCVVFVGVFDFVMLYFCGLGYDYDVSYSMADFFVGIVASDDVDFVGAFVKSVVGVVNVLCVKLMMLK